MSNLTGRQRRTRADLAEAHHARKALRGANHSATRGQMRAAIRIGMRRAGRQT